MNKYKPREILEQGIILGFWACDVGQYGTESSAGKEHLIEFNKEYFIIITSVYSGKILKWQKVDREAEIKENGFIGKYIREYEKLNKGTRN